MKEQQENRVEVHDNHHQYIDVQPSWTRKGWLITACLLLLLCGLCTTWAQTYVCGTVWGTWTKANSPYILTCDVLAADLEIEPGVTICASNYTFEVQGVLTAIGTEAEPIVFKACDPAVGWQGIFFNYSSPGSQMHYCIVSNSVNSGVRLVYSLPYLKHCTIANNSAPYQGGGINASPMAGNLILECCEIRGNTVNPSGNSGTYYGGGVYVVGGVLMRNCLVATNLVQGCAEREATRYANGGGLYVEGNADIRNCTFRGNAANEWGCGHWNAAYAYGGGMMASGAGPLSVANSIFSDNAVSSMSGSYGSGLYINSSVSSPSVVNCTFAYNNIEGLNSSAPGTVVMNSILYFNAGGGTQLVGTTNVTYCDVQGGFAGQGNINFAPIFCGSSFLRIVPGSKCVDAGNPLSAYNDACFSQVNCSDPLALSSLGTVRNDIGAHGGPGACCWVCGSCTAPVIRSEPEDVTACVGGSATFCVGATGSQPLTYQWRFHGTNPTGAPVDIGGATNACYTISNVQSNHAGHYSVRVANALGSLVSRTNLLMVTPVCVSIDLYAGLFMSGGVPGQSYRILSTTDLTPPVAWTTNATFIQSGGGTLWVDTNSPANKPKRFYTVAE
jgi:hypothetical protein